MTLSILGRTISPSSALLKLSFLFFTDMVEFIFSGKLTFVGDFEPLCQIQTKRLGAICENVEGDLTRNQEREKTKKDGQPQNVPVACL